MTEDLKFYDGVQDQKSRRSKPGGGQTSPGIGDWLADRVKKLNRKRSLPNIHPGVTSLGVRLKR